MAAAHPVAAEALASGLGRALGGCVTALQPLSGGASQETWAFTLHRPAGPADGRRLVLRRAAPGAAARQAHSAGLAAEAALIDLAAGAGVPVPALVHRLQPADGLGDGFITAWLPGETLGRRLAAAHRPALAAQCGSALARLHALPLHRLPTLRHTQPRAEVAHLGAWHAGHHTVRPVFQLALRWLARRAPADVPPTLVHGDFRNGNLMVDLADDRLLAVLDWELAHTGDPMADLGWLAVHSWRFGQPQRPVGGFGHWAELLDAYRAAGGTVDLDRLRWWQVLGTLRWGVICESMGAAWLSGAEPAMEKAAIARRASETELDLMHLLAPEGAQATAGTVRLPESAGTAPGEGGAATAAHTPDAAALLAAVSHWLRDALLPQLDGAAAYQARVAAGLLDTVARDGALRPAADAAERARLQALLADGADDAPLAALRQRLAQAIADGRLDLATPGLAAHLWASCRASLAIDQPRYDGLHRPPEPPLPATA